MGLRHRNHSAHFRRAQLPHDRRQTRAGALGLVGNLESLGRASFSTNRGGWLQRVGQTEGLVLSALSLVRALDGLLDRQLACCGLCCLRYRVAYRGAHLPEIDCAGFFNGRGAARSLVLFDFPNGVLSPHRLHREPLPRPDAGLHFCRPQRTLVARGCAWRAFLGNAREWNHLAAHARDGSGTPMVRAETLALAMALDRNRSGRLRGLFVS